MGLDNSIDNLPLPTLTGAVIDRTIIGKWVSVVDNEGAKLSFKGLSQLIGLTLNDIAEGAKKKMKKKTSKPDLYVKFVTTGLGFISILSVLYSVLYNSLYGIVVSLIFSLFYFSDKDIRILYKLNPNNFRIVMSAFLFWDLLMF